MGDVVTRYKATFQIEAVPTHGELHDAEKRIREANPFGIRYVAFGDVRTGAGVPGAKLDIFDLPNPVVDCVYDATLPEASAAAAITKGLSASINGGTTLLGVVKEALRQGAADAGAAAGAVVDAGVEGALSGIATSPTTLFVAGGIAYVVLRS